MQAILLPLLPLYDAPKSASVGGGNDFTFNSTKICLKLWFWVDEICQARISFRKLNGKLNTFWFFKLYSRLKSSKMFFRVSKTCNPQHFQFHV